VKVHVSPQGDELSLLLTSPLFGEICERTCE